MSDQNARQTQEIRDRNRDARLATMAEAQRLADQRRQQQESRRN